MVKSINPLTKTEKSLIATLGALQFTHIVDFMIIMPLGPQLMKLFQITPTQFGMLVSSYTFAAGFVNLCSAYMMDRLDRKKTLLFFAVGFSISTIFCALAWDYTSLLAARFIAGCFGGVIGSMVMLIVSDSIAYEKRATAFGFLMTAFSVASTFGVPLSIYIANLYNWHMPFLILGILAAIMCVVIYFTVPPVDAHLKSPRRSLIEMFKNIFMTPSLLGGLAFMVALVLGQFLIIPFLSPSLVANAGFTQAQLPYIYIVGGISSMLAAPMIGRLADTHGKKRIFLISAFGSLLPLFLITNLSPEPIYLILMQVSLFFIMTSGRMVPATAMISEVAPIEIRGSFMTISTAIQQIAMGAGSFLAANIVSSSSDGKLLNYHRVGYLAMLGTLAAIYLVRGIHPAKKTI